MEVKLLLGPQISKNSQVDLKALTGVLKNEPASKIMDILEEYFPDAIIMEKLVANKRYYIIQKADSQFEEIFENAILHSDFEEGTRD